MNIYKSCSDIPIWNFTEISLKGDLKWMVVGYDGYTDVKVPKGANESWQDIRNEYVEILDDNAIIYYYNLVQEIFYFEVRHDIVKELLGQIAIRSMDEETFDKYLDMLKEWGFKWNKKNAKKKEYERMTKQHKAGLNKINLKKDELKRLKEENNFEDVPNTLEKQAVVVEQILGKNNIDLKITTTLKWVELVKMANRVNEERRKNGRK